MARLTRTQKYADLREQLANDREESLATDELKVYEDKLKSVDSNFNSGIQREVLYKPQPEPVQEPKPVNEPVKENNYSGYDSYGNFDSVQKEEPKQETSHLSNNLHNIQNEIKDDNPFNTEAIKVDDESFFDFISSLNQNLDTQPVQEPIKQEPPIAEFEQTINKPVEKEPEIINNYEENIEDIVHELENDFESLNGKVEPIKEEPKVEIKDDYLVETLKEVNEHNKNDGLTTMEEIPNNMVNAIRHPGQPVNENTNDEFSNTVTLEIDKVLSEINAQQEAEIKQQEEKDQFIKEAQFNETIKPEPQPIPQTEKVEVKPEPVKEEHPVLTKSLEPEIEIKSMEETLTQEVLDDTIPFKVNDEENVIEEYEDDEAPNKVLNIILVVLIVILLAILGVIVYYILFAKGIIG